MIARNKQGLYGVALFLFTIAIVYSLIQLWEASFGAGKPRVLPGDVVLNFTDCVKKGHPIVANNPDQCLSPSGVLFMNLQQYLSTTEIYTQAGGRQKAAAKAIASSTVSTTKDASVVKGK